MNRHFTSLKRGFMMSMIILAMAVLLNVVLPFDAGAHKVNVFAYVEGDRIVVEGYFSGNVKAQNCIVRVLDTSGNKLLEGKTDTKGSHSFAIKELPPFKGGLKIVLDAEMGHRAEYNLAESELPNIRGEEPPKPQSEGTVPNAPPAVVDGTKKSDAGTPAASVEQKLSSKLESKPESDRMTASAPSPQPVVDEQTLQRTLAAVLDEKLAPVLRMLGNQERMILEEKTRGPRFSDIVGGVGWIFGIVGTAAFFWGRSRSSS